MSKRLPVFLKCAAACAALAGACPAHADVSALYDGGFGPLSMTVEADNAGDVRLQMGVGASYYLFTGGKAYIVQRGPSGPYAAELGPYFRIQMEQMRGFTEVLKALQEKGEVPTPKLVPLGPVEIHGRTGTGYSMDIASDQETEQVEAARYPMLVISEDPQLAPLGAAFVQFQRASGESISQIIPPFGMFADDTIKAMGSGAPLRVGPFELSQVATTAIDPERFALPGDPITEDQMRAMSMPFAPPSAFPDVGKDVAHSEKTSVIGRPIPGD